MNAHDCPQIDLAHALGEISSMPEYLERAFASAGPARLATAPARGGFSLLEHACHLRDLEAEGYAVRVRRLLEEERPELEGFDGARVASERDYRSQDARAALDEFTATRNALSVRVAALAEDDRCREGVFAGKPVTLEGMVAMMAGHDREHRAEIERLLEELAR
jgi:ATP phosphoribosyltransferase regulatory subunit HisZ